MLLILAHLICAHILSKAVFFCAIYPRPYHNSSFSFLLHLSIEKNSSPLISNSSLPFVCFVEYRLRRVLLNDVYVHPSPYLNNIAFTLCTRRVATRSKFQCIISICELHSDMISNLPPLCISLPEQYLSCRVFV